VLANRVTLGATDQRARSVPTTYPLANGGSGGALQPLETGHRSGFRVRGLAAGKITHPGSAQRDSVLVGGRGLGWSLRARKGVARSLDHSRALGRFPEMKFKHTPPHLLLCALFHLPALPPGNKAALYGLPIASPAGNGPPWFTKMLMFSLRAEPRPAPEHDRAADPVQRRNMIARFVHATYGLPIASPRRSSND